jgi:transposase
MTHPQLILGIDTHKDIHVAVLLDRLGRWLAAASFGTTDAANRDLVAWTHRYGQVTSAGVEGTGSYGYRLAQYLTAQGIKVVEVNRPDRARRRRKGKTDPVDAEAAARAVLAGDARAVPRTATAPSGSCAPCSSPAAARSRPAPRPPTRSARCWSTATTTSAASCVSFARRSWRAPALSLPPRPACAWP